MNGFALTFPLIALLLTACSNATQSSDDSTRNAAVVADLNAWWKSSEVSQPEKLGTITPAHTITTRQGAVLQIAKHIQTEQEYAEQLDDYHWDQHRRSIVKDFGVSVDTVTVLTNLTRNSTYDLNPIDKRDAQELCHELGSFVWANQGRRWGLKNINILGANGELLSRRNGLAGKVQ
jgi:flagellar biosynthesis component FlhA